jgi:hypothetical protein
MVGGVETVFSATKPYFEPMGKNIVHIDGNADLDHSAIITALEKLANHKVG